MLREFKILPKILLVNFHSTMNAGDLGLLITARDMLLNVFPGSEFVVSANWPHESAYQENNFTVVPSPWSLSDLDKNTNVFEQILKFLLVCRALCDTKTVRTSSIPDIDILKAAYRDADIIVSVPGNQFYSSGRYGWPFPVSVSGVLLAHYYNKPLLVLPQSIGPLRRWWEQGLIRQAYSKARRVFLRDEVSIDLAKAIALPMEKVHYVPDPALSLQPDDSASALILLVESGMKLFKPKLGVTIISKMNRSFDSQKMCNYYEVLETTLAKFSRIHDVQIVFFTQVSGPTEAENDAIPTARMVSTLVEEGVDAIHIDKTLSPSLLKACYGHMKIFVATRLHSGIFALGMNVPTLFIGYLSKTRGLVKSLQIEDDFIEIDDIDLPILMEKLESLWTHSEEKSLHIANVVKVARQEIEESVELLKKDFADA